MVTVTTKDYSPLLEPRQDPEEAGREAERLSARERRASSGVSFHDNEDRRRQNARGEGDCRRQ